MFAKRTDWQLKKNRITETLEQLKRGRTPILDFTQSNPAECGFQFYNRALLKPFQSKINLYYKPDARGVLKSRQAIARLYRRHQMLFSTPILPNQIILTASTSEAYSFLFRLLAEPGDEILCPRPSYPLFNFLAQLNDVQLQHYPLIYDGGWEIDIENLKRACGPKTKAIILVNPNNPTGSYVKHHELVEIIKFAWSRKIAIISDEVFSDFHFENRKHCATSLASFSSYLGFTLNGISKALGLPHMKLAWIVAQGEKKILRDTFERLEMISDTYLSVNTPVQNALPVWLKSRGKIQSEIRARLNENRKFLQNSLQNHPCSLLSSDGGWYAILRLPRLKTEEEWCLEFLKKDHVFVHPGYFFDFEREAHIVISLLPPLKAFRNGASKILERIQRNSENCP